MNKKVGIISAIGGAVSSAIGIIVSSCIVCAPACGGCCISGPLVAIFGIGVAGFFHKHDRVFIVVGALLFLMGIFLMFKKKKRLSCGCPIPEKNQADLKAEMYPDMDKQKIKNSVKKAYGNIAASGVGCGCGSSESETTQFAKSVGYSDEELRNIPEAANLGLSCGNPTALASLREGETVLDLGSGAGFDCFLAASRVGQKGKIIGVDMTPEMISRARDNAKKNNIQNVEFKIGEIENLPLEDNSVDVIISNCVINLSSDKLKVYQEAYRVLKPQGRIAISDIALTKELPKKIRENIDAHVGCVAGAVLVDDYKKIVGEAGFKDVKITIKNSSCCIKPDTKDPLGRAILGSLNEGESIEGSVVSIYVEGKK